MNTWSHPDGPVFMRYRGKRELVRTEEGLPRVGTKRRNRMQQLPYSHLSLFGDAMKGIVRLIEDDFNDILIPLGVKAVIDLPPSRQGPNLEILGRKLARKYMK